jgi:beta-ribofuranosylaminobenzene 5'-phosphate synthase
MSVRVVAPCRLHFGLFHVPVDGLTHHSDGRPVMMIDNPCVTVTAERTESTVVSGSLSDRGREYLERLQEDVRGRLEWEVIANGPQEHVGFGVGTALGLAMASIVRSSFWQSPASSVQWLAERVGRGQRSRIGTLGFRYGGFITDNGKGGDDESQNRGWRYAFPFPWRIVLVRPPTLSQWFGDRERTAFARTRPADRALSLTDQLRSLAYDTVVPAVRDADFDTFAQSIADFNRLAGEPFHDDQGGPYAGAEVACVIDELMEMGAVGVGQSSWGPTVFAMCRDADEAERLAVKARARFSSATEVTVTAANNTGSRIETA